MEPKKRIVIVGPNAWDRIKDDIEDLEKMFDCKIILAEDIGE